MEANAPSIITLPKFIYVSELLRTWETAVLLFLRSSIILTLYISPFLREKPTLIPSLGLRKQELFPSDVPGELKEQVREFVRFIAFLRELKKLDIDGISGLIPERFTIILKHFDGNFTDEYVESIGNSEGIELSISDGGIQIACNFSENTGLPSRLGGNKETIQQMFEVIQVDTNSVYVPYSDTTLETALVFPNASSVPNVGNMDTPSTPAGSLADFVDWYNRLTTKPHGAGNIVTAVSHSGTMKTFVKQVEELNSSPSQQFETAYEEAIGTNTCSLVFKSKGPTFNIFRHAHSCDNRNMNKGTITSTSKRFGDSGKYASLSLWGILSTLKFSNKKLNALITTQEITSPLGLKICRGMDKESDRYLADNYDSMNVLCGEQRDRLPIGNFSLSLGHCGTSKETKLPTFDSNCIRIITDPNGRKVVLYLDTTKKVIQARFFESAEKSTKYDAKIELFTISLDEQLNSIVFYFFSSLVKFDDNELVSYLKLELIESIKNFIESNTEIDSEWKELLMPLYKSYIDKKDKKASAFVDSSSQEQLALHISAGGTNKRTRRHRRRHGNHKVIRKYTRKNKKYNPRRKSRRIRKRKQTHKRKLGKSRKLRKSCKSRK